MQAYRKPIPRQEDGGIARAAPLLPEDDERVPGSRDDRELPDRDREEDSADGEGVEDRDQRPRPEDHARHVALRVTHLPAGRAHELEAERRVEQGRKIRERCRSTSGRRLDSENSLAGGRPAKSAESPRTPRARKISALTTAPRFGSHFETSSRTIPTSDRQPGQHDRDPGLLPGRVGLQEDLPEGPGEDQVDRRGPGRVVDPVHPGGHGAPLRAERLADPDVDAALPRPGRAELGRDQAVGDEEDRHRDGPPGEPRSTPSRPRRPGCRSSGWRRR